MIHIAVCDDEALELQKMKLMISDYLQSRSESGIAIHYFQSADKLLEAIETRTFQIYLLDIIMSGTNGIQLGECIRQKDQTAAIIYLTVSPDYAVASYTVGAYYYLLKPLEEDTLFPVLDRAVLNFKKAEEVLVIHTKLGDISIPADQIIYVEYHNHMLTYHLTTGSSIDSRTFRTSFDEEAQPLLQNNCFVKISSAFVVNLSLVKDFTGKIFLMSDGAELSITRAYSDTVKQMYLQYLLNGVHRHDL